MIASHACSAPLTPSRSDQVCLVPGSPVVRVEAAPGNARRIFTGVDIVAEGDAMEMVWRTLTDYPRLAEVVPNLISNTVLRADDDGRGARLQQVAGYHPWHARRLTPLHPVFAPSQVGVHDTCTCTGA